VTWRPTADAVVRLALAELGPEPAVVVHGSVGLGGWLPGQSDVDLLVIVPQAPAPGPLAAFAESVAELTGPTGPPVELSVIEQTLAARPQAPWPFLVQVAGRRIVPAGVDSNLALHLAVARAVGIAVRGPDPAGLIGEVPRPVLRGQLVDELEWALHRGSEHDVVLNACRALAYQEREVLLSKQDGATWARFRLPEHAALIGRILDERQTALTDRHFSPEWERRPGPQAHALAAEVIRRLSALEAPA
jgi:streptomycin 3"-adenylyltransferase